VIRRIVGLLFGLLAAGLMLTLAVANRHSVTLVLDPFSADNPVVALDLPFYAYLFGTLIVGVVMGGMATYFSQSKWRRTARNRTQESIRWKAEADRLVREREAAALAAGNAGTGTGGSGRQLALGR
jgi:uncharacterized integral membrane protein